MMFSRCAMRFSSVLVMLSGLVMLVACHIEVSVGFCPRKRKAVALNWFLGRGKFARLSPGNAPNHV
jgi:hypothetical protein